MPAGGGWVRYQFTLKDFASAPADGKKSKEGPRPKDVKMVFDPKDQRISAFVEHLGRSGIKLAHEESNRGRWRMVEPKLPDGIIFFDICTFNAPASSEQMSEAASDFSWGWQYQNVPAQLSMSEPYGGEVGSEPSDDLSALHEKLRFHFFWYERDRDKPPADLLTNEVINAGRDPKDERIRALVANLTKNGIKLEYSDDAGDWRIVEPKHADGTMSVSIRSFPIAASEEQMRWAVSGINLAYQLNVSAHLAISHISMKGSAKGKTPVVESLEKKLLRLFHKHAPAGLGAHVGDFDDESTKELHALWDFLKARGIELKYVDNSSNYIQQLFSVGPDHGKRMCVGLNTAAHAKAEGLRKSTATIQSSTFRAGIYSSSKLVGRTAPTRRSTPPSGTRYSPHSMRSPAGRSRRTTSLPRGGCRTSRSSRSEALRRPADGRQQRRVVQAQARPRLRGVSRVD